MKSLSGGAYAATQNPTGAVAKVNQVAATQPPTVVIQATSSGPVFNYKDDCYVFNGDGMADAASWYPTNIRVGLGKVSVSNQFTGMLAANNTMASAVLISASVGMFVSPGSSYPTTYYSVGTAYSVAWQYTNVSGYAGANGVIVGVNNLPIANISKCYP